MLTHNKQIPSLSTAEDKLQLPSTDIDDTSSADDEESSLNPGIEPVVTNSFIEMDTKVDEAGDAETKPQNKSRDLRILSNVVTLSESRNDTSRGDGSPPHNASDSWSYNEEDVIVSGKTHTDKFFRSTDKSLKNIPRKVYFSMKILRFSDIHNVEESFRCRFHLYMNWIMTEKEYIDYQKAKLSPKARKCWEPKFKPRIALVNSVHAHEEVCLEYPPDGHYRCMYFPDWVDEETCGFDKHKTPFLRQKMQYDVTFSEQMELRTFPVDCQDFSIIIQDEAGIKKCILMPEPRYKKLSLDDDDDLDDDDVEQELDPTFSVLDEWDFYAARVEVGGSSSSASRSKKSNSQICVRFKLRRRWSVYMFNYIVYFMIISFISLTCFSLDFGDIGERMNLAVVILLTLVSFQHTVFAKLPKIPYLTLIYKYIFVSFLFVCGVLLQSSFLQTINDILEESAATVGETTGFVESGDTLFGFAFFLIWIGYNGYFLLRAMWLRHLQSAKLLMDSDEVEKHTDEKYPQFLMSWRWFNDIEEAGGIDEWLQIREEFEEKEFAELSHQNSFKEQVKGKRNKQNEEVSEGKKKTAIGGMTFSDDGLIVSFTSFSVKEIRSEMGFCQWFSKKIKYYGGKSIVKLCCCGCCRKRSSVETLRKQGKSTLKTAGRVKRSQTQEHM